MSAEPLTQKVRLQRLAHFLNLVCKHILDAAGVTYDDSADLPKLYALTAKQLNLSPSQHTEQLFKQILGGCQTIVEGLGAMRNRHSDARLAMPLCWPT